MENLNIYVDDTLIELRADPFYSAENQARLQLSKERMERIGGTVHELIEVDDD